MQSQIISQIYSHIINIVHLCLFFVFVFFVFYFKNINNWKIEASRRYGKLGAQAKPFITVSKILNRDVNNEHSEQSKQQKSFNSFVIWVNVCMTQLQMFQKVEYG